MIDVNSHPAGDSKILKSQTLDSSEDNVKKIPLPQLMSIIAYLNSGVRK